MRGAAYGCVAGVDSELGDATGSGGRTDVLDAVAPYAPLRPRLSLLLVNKPGVAAAPVPAVGDERLSIACGEDPPRAGTVIVVSSDGRRTRIESDAAPLPEGATAPAALPVVVGLDEAAGEGAGP